MADPIEIRNLDDYTTPTRDNFRTVNVTFTVPVNITSKLPMPSNEEIQKHMNYICKDWSDGRYPLDVEILSRAVGDILKYGMQKAKLEQFSADPNNQGMLELSPRSSINKAYYEHGKWLKEAELYAFGVDDITVEKIEDRKD